MHSDLHRQAKVLKGSLADEAGTARANRWAIGRAAAALLRREHGSTLLEVALVLPVLLTVFTGIVAFGVAYNNALTLNRAVGAGAQYLQLIRTNTSDPCADTFTAVQNSAPGLTGSKIVLSFNLNGAAYSGNTCSGGQAQLVAGAPVTVTGTYPCHLQIYGMTLASSCQLSAKVTEYEY